MRVKVREAAEILGVSNEYIRIGLQKGILPIGTAVKMSSVWTYHISPKLLEDYSGVDVTETINKMRGDTNGKQATFTMTYPKI